MSAIDPLGLDFYVYNWRTGGDGWGHTGMIFPNSNGTYTKYSQGARNPEADRMDLFMRKEPAIVHVTQSENFPHPNAELVFIKTEHNDLIRKAIDAYIAKNSKYHPITNNCADFITDTANKAPDVDLDGDSVPNDFMDNLFEDFGRAKPPGAD
jgi:hypothetical protein